MKTPAEIDLAHQEVVFAISFDHFSGDAQAHGCLLGNIEWQHSGRLRSRLEVVSRNRQLPQAQSTIIGRHQTMPVNMESLDAQVRFNLNSQECIHEHSTAENHIFKSGLLPQPAANRADECNHCGMEAPGDEGSFLPVAGVLCHSLNERPRIDDKSVLGTFSFFTLDQVEWVRSIFGDSSCQPLQFYRGLTFVGNALPQSGEGGHRIEEPAALDVRGA